MKPVQQSLLSSFSWLVMGSFVCFHAGVQTFPRLWAVPSQASGSLSPKECQSLYEHQLRLARQDDVPLAPALKLNLEHFKKQSTRRRQLDHCQKNTSHREYQCQMQAKGFQSLLHCSKQKKRETRDIDRPVVPELRVNIANCKKTYQYILERVRQTKAFQEQKERKRLQQYWESKEARRSFQQRCLKRFSEQDLQCIKDALEMDTLSGCLLSIPE